MTNSIYRLAGKGSESGYLEFFSPEKPLRDGNLSIVRWHAWLVDYFDVEEYVTPSLQAAIAQDAWIVNGIWYSLSRITDEDSLGPAIRLLQLANSADFPEDLKPERITIRIDLPEL